MEALTESAVNGGPTLKSAEVAAPCTDITAQPARRSPRLTAPNPRAEADPFDEIDFGSFFDDYLDPGYKSPSAENRSRSRRLKLSFPRRSRWPIIFTRSSRSK